MEMNPMEESVVIIDLDLLITFLKRHKSNKIKPLFDKKLLYNNNHFVKNLYTNEFVKELRNSFDKVGLFDCDLTKDKIKKYLGYYTKETFDFIKDKNDCYGRFLNHEGNKKVLFILSGSYDIHPAFQDNVIRTSQKNYMNGLETLSNEIKSINWKKLKNFKPKIKLINSKIYKKLEKKRRNLYIKSDSNFHKKKEYGRFNKKISEAYEKKNTFTKNTKSLIVLDIDGVFKNAIELIPYYTKNVKYNGKVDAFKPIKQDNGHWEKVVVHSIRYKTRAFIHYLLNTFDYVGIWTCSQPVNLKIFLDLLKIPTSKFLFTWTLDSCITGNFKQLDLIPLIFPEKNIQPDKIILIDDLWGHRVVNPERQILVPVYSYPDNVLEILLKRMKTIQWKNKKSYIKSIEKVNKVFEPSVKPKKKKKSILQRIFKR